MPFQVNINYLYNIYKLHIFPASKHEYNTSTLTINPELQGFDGLSVWWQHSPLLLNN